MENYPVSIEQGSCSACFRCLQYCDVNAINKIGTQASIMPNWCTFCGKCVAVCPNDMIKIKSDGSKVKTIIKKHNIIIASLSCAWVTEFPGISIHSFVEALKLIGFTHVSETALGAEETLRQAQNYLSHHPGTIISSQCPAVVAKIEKHYPSLIPYLLPVHAPVMLHASMLKQQYGQEAQIVSIGSCVAEKQQIQGESPLAASMTFTQLRELFDESGVNPGNMQEVETYNFEPYKAIAQNLYPISGELFKDVAPKEGENATEVFCYSDNQVDDVLTELLTADKSKSIFIDLLACPDGCLQGAGLLQDGRKMQRKTQLIEYHRASLETKQTTIEPSYIHTIPSFNQKRVEKKVAIDEIRKALKLLLMDLSKPLPDCGACGYRSCNEFAARMTIGAAEKEHCCWYNQKKAQDKLRVILGRMTSGVFIVDDQMKILDANRNFAVLMGADVEMIYNRHNGMEGIDITSMVPFLKNVKQLLESGEDLMEKDIQVKERMLKLSLFTIHKHRVVGGIVRNLFHSDVRSDEIIRRTRKVINDNLDTVQQIAFLLGKNASRTEAILNSIVESQNLDNEQQ